MVDVPEKIILAGGSIPVGIRCEIYY